MARALSSHQEAGVAAAQILVNSGTSITWVRNAIPPIDTGTMITNKHNIGLLLYKRLNTLSPRYR